jgi:Gas vesicle synthesis protein GvpL/GvpF
VSKPQTAPSSARIYPAGRAVLLHAYGSAELAGRRFAIEGRRIQAIRYGRLALLVGFADQAAYAPEAIERNRNEPGWLETEARIHERAVERAAVHVPVVPARLLSVYSHPEALEQAARSAYVRWSRSLARLSGKREYVLHAFVGPHAPPGGEAYVLRVSSRAGRSARAPVPKAQPEISSEVQALWRVCGGIASAARALHRPTARGALGSIAYLFDEERSAAAREHVEQSSQSGAPLGISYYLEGPRLPFTFA